MPELRTKTKISVILGGLVFFFCLTPQISAANSPPSVGTINPSSGVSNPNEAVTFTTTYSDPDGWQDIQYGLFLINTAVNGATCFYGYYNQNQNKLYLRNNDNTAWLGGFAPGSANIIENSYAKLDCSKTTISGSGNTLTVKWNVIFMPTFTGTKNTYLYVRDDANAYNGWTKVGTWIIPTIVDQDITKDTTWTLANSPYIVRGDIYVNSSTANPITLTIEPGVEVRFEVWPYAYYSGLAIGEKARLYAVGTSSKPIKFTSNSTTPQPGDWTGLKFNSNAANTLDYCIVEYAGLGGYDSSANIYCERNSNLTLKNSIIRKSRNCGVYVMYESSPVITNNTFSDNTSYPISIPASVVNNLSNNTFLNNTKNAILVRGEDVIKSCVWKNAGVPYVVMGEVRFFSWTAAPAILTIEPGVEIKFDKDWQGGITIGLDSDHKGSLRAIGTTDKPIKFTSDQSNPQPGDWRSITFTEGAVNSILDNCIVEYGGLYGSMISCWLSSPIIKNCKIRKSKSEGIQLGGASALIENNIVENNIGEGMYIWGRSPIIKFNTIRNNKYGIYIEAGDLFRLHNNNIYNNTSYNIYNNNSGVDARLNWWGTAAGPLKIQNVAISEPWLGQAVNPAFNFTQASLSPKEFSQNGGITTFNANLSSNANWKIEIQDTGNNLVKTLTGTGRSIQQNYDGKDSGNQPLPDGVYTYSIQAQDTSTGQVAAPAIGKLKLTGNIPVAKINSPRPDTIIAAGGSINITGTAKATGAASLNSYKVEYGIGLSPAYWEEIKSATTPVENATLTTWDTKDEIDPVYTLRLTVTDTNNKTAQDKVSIGLFTIYGVYAPEFFSPNNDGNQDTATIGATTNYLANWKIGILNSSNTVVRNFSGVGNSIYQVWDGKDNSGNILPDGTYTYKINVTELNSGVPAPTKTGTIMLDKTYPVAQITSPAQGAVLTQTINIKGTASDANLSYYTVQYGEGANSTSWTEIKNSSSSISNGTLAIWETNDLNNGIYVLKLTVYDKAGNISVAQKQITVDNVKITGVSINPLSFNPSKAQTVNINYTLDRNCLIDLKIYDLNNNLIRILINSLARAQGAHSEIWDGKDDSGAVVTDGGYTLYIKAVNGQIQGYYQSSGGFIENAVGVSGFSFTQDFNPYKNQLCQIKYTLNQNALVEIMAGQHNRDALTLVNWEIRPKGLNMEYWDGHDAKGNILDYYTAELPAVIAYWTKTLPTNTIVVTSTRQSIDLSVTPYSILPSYFEFAMIRFTLPVQSNVTIKIYSPSAVSVNTLLDNINEPKGTYTVTWTGRDSSNKVVSLKGQYTIKIIAVTPDGKTLNRQGNISVR